MELEICYLPAQCDIESRRGWALTRSWHGSFDSFSFPPRQSSPILFEIVFKLRTCRLGVLSFIFKSSARTTHVPCVPRMQASPDIRNLMVGPRQCRSSGTSLSSHHRAHPHRSISPPLLEETL